jgi:hypothetical protein
VLARDAKGFFMTGLGALLASVVLGGCSTPQIANPVAMVPTEFTVRNKYAASVCLVAEMGKSMIPSTNFVSALTESINKSGVFASVQQCPDADYILQVTMLRLEHLTVEFASEVDFKARWTLTRRSTNEIVFNQDIGTSYSGNIFQTHSGSSFLVLADERVAKDNIKDGLEHLSRMNLSMSPTAHPVSSAGLRGR